LSGVLEDMALTPRVRRCPQCGNTGPYLALRNPQARTAITEREKIRKNEVVLQCRLCERFFPGRFMDAVDIWLD